MAPMGSVHRRFNKANIRALIESGYEVHLLANFTDGEGPEVHNTAFARECTSEGIRIKSLPFCRGSLMKNIRLLPALKEYLQTERFDLVHTHTETGGILLRLCKPAQNGSVFIFTPHGMSFYKGSSLKSQLVYKPLERWICSGMDRNLAMNNEEMHYLQLWNNRTARFVHGIGLDIERMQVDPASVRESIRSGLGIPADALMLLSVGELNSNKNHSAAIKALAMIPADKRPYYVICGVGNLEGPLRELIAELGLESHVRLAGYRSDIPSMVASADIFVFPSYHEGLPVSVLEAMAGGLPVIASAIRGNVDVIRDDHNGYLFNPSSPEEIAGALSKLIADPAKRSEMGHRNREIAAGYSLSVVQDELTRIYHEPR